MSAIGTVMGLIEAGVHEEGDAAAERGHAAADEGAPEEGGISRLLVYHCGDGRFAAGAA